MSWLIVSYPKNIVQECKYKIQSPSRNLDVGRNVMTLCRISECKSMVISSPPHLLLLHKWRNLYSIISVLLSNVRQLRCYFRTNLSLAL